MARKYRLRTSLQWLDGGIQFVDATGDSGNTTFTETNCGVAQIATNTEINIGVGQIGTPKLLFVRATTGRVLVTTRSLTAATASNSIALGDNGFMAVALANTFPGLRIKNTNSGASSLPTTVEYWVAG